MRQISVVLISKSMHAEKSKTAIDSTYYLIIPCDKLTSYQVTGTSKEIKGHIKDKNISVLGLQNIQNCAKRWS